MAHPLPRKKRQKTGFAKSTIYHRLNIAKLDPKIVDEKQLTLKEMILLEKVKSIEKRNELLEKYGGTATFEYYVKRAAQDEERTERKKQIIEALKLAGIPESEKYTYKFDTRIEIVQEISALNKAIPEIEQGEFYITTWNGVIIANEKPEAEETPEEAEAKAAEAKAKEVRARRAAAEEKKSQDTARRVVAEVREDTFDKAISIVETHLNQKPKGFGEKLMDRLTEVYEENK